jgi:hypothetical protein
MKRLILPLALLVIFAAVPVVSASTGGSAEALYWRQWHEWQAQQQQINQNFDKIQKMATDAFATAPAGTSSGRRGATGRSSTGKSM